MSDKKSKRKLNLSKGAFVTELVKTKDISYDRAVKVRSIKANGTGPKFTRIAKIHVSGLKHDGTGPKFPKKTKVYISDIKDGSTGPRIPLIEIADTNNTEVINSNVSGLKLSTRGRARLRIQKNRHK